MSKRNNVLVDFRLYDEDYNKILDVKKKNVSDFLKELDETYSKKFNIDGDFDDSF